MLAHRMCFGTCQRGYIPEASTLTSLLVIYLNPKRLEKLYVLGSHLKLGRRSLLIDRYRLPSFLALIESDGCFQQEKDIVPACFDASDDLRYLLGIGKRIINGFP